MRLICPNCGAQYEVDARVIPDEGRDVQCSNCGHTWFQNPAHLDTELAEELGYELPHQDDVEQDMPESAVQMPEFEDTSDYDDTSEADTPELETPEFETTAPDVPEFGTADEPEDIAPTADIEPEPEISSEPEEEQNLPPALEEETSLGEEPKSTTEHEPEIEPDDDALPDLDDLEEEEPALESSAATTSALKDSVRDILRAEVEFDQAIRRTEGETIETQPDLGLEEPAQDAAKKSLRDRMARLRGLDPADSGIIAGSVAAATGKRRDLLPDIEEINSTLSAASDRDDDGSVPDEDTRRARAERSGFRTVFLLFVLGATALVLLYLFAPLIAAKVPSLAGPMESYVLLANDFRLWLDQILSGASERLTALLGQISGS